jgi:hypothetical protein
MHKISAALHVQALGDNLGRGTEDVRGNTLSKYLLQDTRLRSWLWHYATSRKVAGSIPNEVIGLFNLPNPSSRTMALRSTQPLTAWVLACKGRPERKAGLIAIYASKACYRDSSTLTFIYLLQN